MSKEMKELLKLGICLVGTGMISFSDLILKWCYKFFDIPYEEMNINVTFWIGVAIIISVIVTHILDVKREKVLAIIGLDTIKSTKKFKNRNGYDN